MANDDSTYFHEVKHKLCDLLNEIEFKELEEHSLNNPDKYKDTDLLYLSVFHNLKLLKENLEKCEDGDKDQVCPNSVCHYPDRGFEEMSIWKILEDNIPAQVLQKRPVYNTNSLIISAWTGSLIKSNQGSPQLGDIKWLNKMFRERCEKYFTSISSETAKDPFGEKVNNLVHYLYSDIDKMKPKTEPTVDINEFLNSLANFTDKSNDIINVFIKALNEIVTFTIEQKISLDPAEFESFNKKLKIENENFNKDQAKGIDAEIDWFVRLIGSEDKSLILGARIERLSGIELFASSKLEEGDLEKLERKQGGIGGLNDKEKRRLLILRSKSKLKDSYDVFAVFHLDVNKDKLIDASSFSTVQGLLIPIGKRKVLVDKWRYESLKSAISAIMSRNMSHNLGSHVLSTVSNRINDPTDIQYLTKYIQQRQDYIAQVTTEFPKWTYSYRFIGQVMRYFYEQRLLLKYIVESEGLTAMEYFPKKNDGNDGKLEIIIKKEGDPIIPSSINNKHDFVNVDPLLAIPGGVTGLQAFYSILENVIRNAAKHSYSKESNEGLKIYIDFTEKDTYVEFQIYDNVTKNNLTTYKKHGDKLEKEIALKKVLNDKIKTSFIDGSNNLIYKSWGVAEIKISAGFLVTANIDDIGGSGNDILYRIDKQNNKCGIMDAVETNNSVGYRFRIHKPREVFIDLKPENNNFSDDKNQSIFNSQGIYFMDNNSNRVDSDFIITDEEISENNKNGLSLRIFYFTEIQNEFNRLDPERKDFVEQAENFKLYLYSKWLSKINDRDIVLKINPYEEKNSAAVFHPTGQITDYLKEKYPKESEDNWIYNNDDFSSDLYNQIIEVVHCEDDDVIENLEGVIDKISEKYNSIEEIVDNVFKKYNEFIETLPENYRFSGEKSKEEKESQVAEEILIYEMKLRKIIKGLPPESRISNDYEQNSNSKNIILQRHMSFEQDKNSIYREALSGAQSYFNEVKSISDNYMGKKLIYNIIESAVISIHIIDERMAEFYNCADSKIKARIKNGNIRIYYAIDNVDKAIIKVNEKSFSDNIFEWSSDSSRYNNNDILIVHQGILDKFSKNNFKDNEGNRLSIEKPKSIMPGNYFVTSGRGKPEVEKMPKSAKYIPFSNINSALMKQYPEKILLVQSLLKISK